jgi:hypothetical protein
MQGGRAPPDAEKKRTAAAQAEAASRALSAEFDQLSQEVDERKAFLEQLPPPVPRQNMVPVRQEIADRWARMKVCAARADSP